MINEKNELLKVLKIECSKYRKQLAFYNSMSKKEESFSPIAAPKVTLYTCGPTVYDYAHIGNLRTFLFEDLLVRVLRLVGYDVTHVMNITDVDDKTILRSIEKGVSLNEYTKLYTAAFFEDLKSLNVHMASHYPRATDHIREMIMMIEMLIDKGHAYVRKDGDGSDPSVYFRISSFSEYGMLAQIKPSEIGCEEGRDTVEVTRDEDEYGPDQVRDFALWKGYHPGRDGQIFWESPFGRGRPGWHIECSAMARALLGDTLDIHTGGIDNLFPHHENEIAQSYCCYGKPLANIWLHAQHLRVEGQKMSKSLGNFYTLRDLIAQGYDPMTLRFLLIQTHYRGSLNFTFEGLRAASVSLQRLATTLQRVEEAPPLDEEHFHQTEQREHFVRGLHTYAARFISSLCRDLGISGALCAVFDAARHINTALDADPSLSDRERQTALSIFDLFDEVLASIRPMYAKIVQEARQGLSAAEELLKQREHARKERDFVLADALRGKIGAMGYLIEDTPHGAKLKKSQA